MKNVNIDSTMAVSTAFTNLNGGLLDVKFKSGETYRYMGVPSKVYQMLKTAYSFGQTYNKFVKGLYPVRNLSKTYATGQWDNYNAPANPRLLPSENTSEFRTIPVKSKDGFIWNL